MKKVISECLQFQLILNNFIYPCKLGGWVKNNMMRIFAFNIAQFFPLLNHHHLLLIHKKAGCDSKVIHLLSNYLVGRKTQYCWNNVSSQFFNIDVGVGQGSALFPILSALYISPVFHILENCLKNLKILVSILSFVNNGLFVAQSKSLLVSNSFLFCSYNIFSSLLEKFSLILEYGKIEVFHFSRFYGAFVPPPLNLSALGDPNLRPRNTWRYLGFIFNRKLLFHQYIDFYMSKVISTVKCIIILRNFIHGLILYQK